jgi:hypothetical protein
MFPKKERNWITGKYDHTIQYDSWSQWITIHVYHNWQYNPLLWNIRDATKPGDHEALQIIYSTKNGEMKLISVIISISPSDEDDIQSWLKQQPWLSN